MMVALCAGHVPRTRRTLDGSLVLKASPKQWFLGSPPNSTSMREWKNVLRVLGDHHMSNTAVWEMRCPPHLLQRANSHEGGVPGGHEGQSQALDGAVGLREALHVSAGWVYLLTTAVLLRIAWIRQTCSKNKKSWPSNSPDLYVLNLKLICGAFLRECPTNVLTFL